jgi:hypothetical protein
VPLSQRTLDVGVLGLCVLRGLSAGRVLSAQGVKVC